MAQCRKNNPVVGYIIFIITYNRVIYIFFFKISLTFFDAFRKYIEDKMLFFGFHIGSKKKLRTFARS